MGKLKRQLLNKCECCGALFQGDYCEYCRAKYNFYEEEKVEPHKETKINAICNDIRSNHITLSFNGKECDFYVAEYGFESLCGDYMEPVMSVRLVSNGRWRDVDNGNIRKD